MSNLKNIRSKNQDMFAKSPYTNSWVRVLQRAGGPYNDEITVRLTPIGSLYAHGWSDVANIHIHKRDVRYSPIDTGTYYTHELPAEVHEEMRKRLDDETFNYLIDADILPQVDWDLYAKSCNGGMFLKECSIKHDGIFKICKLYDGKFRNKEVSSLEFMTHSRIYLSPGKVILSGVIEHEDEMSMKLWTNYNHNNNVITLHYEHREGSSQTVLAMARNANNDWFDAFDNTIKGSRKTTLDQAGDAIITMILEQSRRVMGSIKGGN